MSSVAKPAGKKKSSSKKGPIAGQRSISNFFSMMKKPKAAATPAVTSSQPTPSSAAKSGGPSVSLSAMVTPDTAVLPKAAANARKMLQAPETPVLSSTPPSSNDKGSKSAKASSPKKSAAAAALKTTATTTTAASSSSTSQPKAKAKAKAKARVIEDDDDDSSEEEDADEDDDEAAALALLGGDDDDDDDDDDAAAAANSSRRGQKRVNYAVDAATSEEDGTDVEQAPDHKKKAKKAAGKRLRRVVNDDDDDSDSADEYVPKADEVKAVKNEEAAEMDASEDDSASDAAASIVGENDELFSDAEPSPKKKARKAPKKAAASASSQSAFNNRFGGGGGGGGGAKRASFGGSSSSSSKSKSNSNSNGFGAMKSKVKATEKSAEDMHPWLKDKVDHKKRMPADPDYEKNTLYIPASVLDGTKKKNGKPCLTPFERQYWTVKKDCMETMLFFKKGKFFEVYNEDAWIAMRLFGFKVTDRVNMAMAGFPESQMDKWCKRFMECGFKVAVAKEASTALAHQMGGGKGIVNRELTNVYTPGSLSGDLLVGDLAAYIMSIKEEPGTRRIGVCFADTSTSEFNVCSFEDDAAYSQLETLLVQINPKELVIEKGGLSLDVTRLLKIYAGNLVQNKLEAESQSGFWTGEMAEHQLLMHEGLWKGPNNESDTQYWPEPVQEAIKDKVAMSAIGGLISYMETLLLVNKKKDDSILLQSRFETYNPMGRGTRLMLDGQTLQNLDILQNSADNTEHGSLFSLLCQTVTPFGRRLFRKWLCHPLKHAAEIEERYAAVDELDSNTKGFREMLVGMLKRLPDLERSMSAIHMRRAKIDAFLKTIDAFKEIAESLAEMQEAVATLTPVLKSLLTIGGGRFPDISAELAEFEKRFDWKLARSEGVLVPLRGANEQYDAILEELEEVTAKFETHLSSIKRQFSPKAKWIHTAGKERYQVELPNNVKDIPHDWERLSKTTKLNRWRTPSCRRWLPAMNEALERKNTFLKEMVRTTQGEFDAYSQKWTAVVNCLSHVDCLISLMNAKHAMGEPMCRAKFVDVDAADGSAVFDVKNLRHPCLSESGFVESYIANDTALGGKAPNAMVLTGPNMGGKSTLLRQNCVAVIMAQLGAYVPAESFEYTPVDRIFTRIGANDNIMAGRSTFMVELKETATILRQATPRSLVILDELGRGTSTYDGYAIAHSVLTHLVNETKCRLMFATHYHMLTDTFANVPGVSLDHMGYHVEEGGRDITFLYKLQPGVCPKSFGLNCASKAGVPEEIVSQAEIKSVAMEASSKVAQVSDAVKAKAGRRHLSAYHDLDALLANPQAHTAPMFMSEAKRLLEAFGKM